MASLNTETKHDRGFEITWLNPPLMSHEWSANVASNDPALMRLVQLSPSNGIIAGPTRDAMLINVKLYIDGLLTKG
ncbi:hypothetical protein [Ferrovibrio sp.]|uniref:hypothetical protein n=1 Tax=Ferrovibrio sp. TaxID=1917215 RepID=UPI00260ED1B2|nr:hypothetical protein [Ferrovibrio sp.]